MQSIKLSERKCANLLLETAFGGRERRRVSGVLMWVLMAEGVRNGEEGAFASSFTYFKMW